jgi:hypothetical protein
VLVERVTDTVEFDKPLDWTCPSCAANVFAAKTHCFKCNTPKPAVAAAPDGAASGQASAAAESSAAPATAAAPAAVAPPPTPPPELVATAPAASRGVLAALSAALAALFAQPGAPPPAAQAADAAPAAAAPVWARPRPPWNTWEAVASKQNVAVCVRLQERASGREFAVSHGTSALSFSPLSVSISLV